MTTFSQLSKEDQRRVAVDWIQTEGFSGNNNEPDDGCDSPAEYYFYKNSIGQTFEPYQKSDDINN